MILITTLLRDSNPGFPVSIIKQGLCIVKEDPGGSNRRQQAGMWLLLDGEEAWWVGEGARNFEGHP